MSVFENKVARPFLLMTFVSHSFLRTKVERGVYVCVYVCVGGERHLTFSFFGYQSSEANLRNMNTFVPMMDNKLEC